MAEQQNAMQLRFLNLQDFTSMIAIIDTAANRGAFKAEEFTAIGNLRDKVLAESQHQSQLIQQAQGATNTEQFGGASFEEATPEEGDTVAEEDDEKDVPKANRKPKRK